MVIKLEDDNERWDRRLLRLVWDKIGFQPNLPIAFTIVLETGFERFSGRASETWEMRYTLTMNEHKDQDGKVLIPSFKVYNKLCRGELGSIGDIMDTCKQACQVIEKFNKDNLEGYHCPKEF